MRSTNGLSPEIPYSLLAFYPQFYLQGLPVTSRAHAFRCKEAAERMALKNVHLGNIHAMDVFVIGELGR